MTTTSLGRPAWLCNGTTERVIEALEAIGPGGSRFVGGCVRNTLMGLSVDDIDIATQLTPQDVVKALEADGIRAIPTGLDHGTITAVCNSVPFEITTLRRDVETDGRRAVVAFTEDWAEDAARRDFRMNALYADPDGTVHDPVGGGVEDVVLGRVIFIGDADQRLREDYLRILRFFRFNAWYGAEMDPEGLAACARQKAGLQQIAAERIWKELEKLLRAPEPAEAVEAMHAAGILKEILPVVTKVDRLRWVQERSRDAMVRLMALVPNQPGVEARLADDLRLSNVERERLRSWVNCPLDAETADARAVWAAAYRYGKQVVLDRFMLADGVTDQRVSEVAKLFERWELPVLPVRGQDLKDLGFSGPKIGETLRMLEDWWVDQDFKPGRDELLARLSSLPR